MNFLKKAGACIIAIILILSTFYQAMLVMAENDKYDGSYGYVTSSALYKFNDDQYGKYWGNIDTSHLSWSAQPFSAYPAENFDANNIPAVNFMVEAEKDGMYSICPLYKTNGLTDASGYTMTVLVNDFAVYSHTPDTDILVELKAGRNIIRCVTFCKETYLRNGGWLNISGIRLSEGLTALADNDPLVLYAGDSQYAYRYSTKTAGGALSNTQGPVDYSIKIEDLSPKNISSVPGFSYTIDVPENGYYDMAINYGCGLNGVGYIGLMVDGVPYAKRIRPYSTSEAVASAYLSKGTHIITVTGIMKAFGNEGTTEWTNLRSLTVHGGAILSEKQKDPTAQTVASEPNAGMYKSSDPEKAEENLILKQSDNSIADCSRIAENMPLYADFPYMTPDANRTPFITYYLNAPAEGYYSIGAGFTLRNFADENNYTVTALINDSAVVSIGKSDYRYIKLKSGLNFIRLIPFVEETFACRGDSGEISIDHLFFDNRLTQADNNQLKLNPGEAEYYNRYTVSGSSLINDQGLVDSNMTIANLAMDTLQTVPYFSYSVSAPENGYYDIRLAYKATSSKKSYIGLMVDGNTTAFSTLPDGESVVNLSAYLESGDHTLSFTCLMPASYGSGSYIPTDFTALTIFGNITKCAMQSKPYIDANAEPEQVGNYLRYDASFAVGTNYTYESNSNGNYYDKGIYDYLDNAALSFSDLRQTTLDSNNMPYVTYTVVAPINGYFEIYCNYDHGGFKSETGYYMAVLVNDTTNYRQTGDYISVRLNAGRNTVRLIPFVKETQTANRGSDGWVNIRSLDVDKRLSCLRVSKLALGVSASEYIHRATIMDSYAELSGYTVAQSSGITISDITADNLNKIPYISYTVEAPASGYYDIYLNYSTVFEGIGYVGMIVDGTPTAKRMRPNGTSNGLFSAKLTAGVHVITFTCFMPKGTSGGYNRLQVNQAIFYGLTRAEKQLNPEGNYTRLQAETYSQRNALYTGVEKGSYSGGYAVAEGRYNYTALQTLEDAKKKPDESSLPYIAYQVDCPAEGDYDIRVGYLLGGGKDYGDYIPYIYMYVSGTLYQVPFEEIKGQVTCAKLKAHFKEGVNLVQVMIYTAEVYEKIGEAWVNHDYLDIAEPLKGIMPEQMQPETPDYTRFEAENCGWPNYYTSINSNMSASGGNYRYAGGTLFAQSAADIEMNGLKEPITPYIEYHVTVPEDGDYPIRIGLLFSHDGDEMPKDNKAFIYVVANGQPKRCELTVTNNLTSFATLKNTVRLKKGENRIQITCATSDAISDDQFSTLAIYQDYLDVYGKATSDSMGITVEAETSSMNKYSAEASAGCSGGMAAMREIFTQVWKNQISFATLPEAKLAMVAHVKYKVVAPKTDTYRICVRFNSSTSTPDKIGPWPYFVAMIVNNDAPQKFEYTRGYYQSRMVDVKLQEGENSIILTGALTDLMANSTDVVWIDHDCLILPEGLASVVVKPDVLGAGDDLANFADAQIQVAGGKRKELVDPSSQATEQKREQSSTRYETDDYFITDNGDETDDQTTDPIVTTKNQKIRNKRKVIRRIEEDSVLPIFWIIVIVATIVLIAAGIWLFFIIKKKKQKKEKE